MAINLNSFAPVQCKLESWSWNIKSIKPRLIILLSMLRYHKRRTWLLLVVRKASAWRGMISTRPRNFIMPIARHGYHAWRWSSSVHYFDIKLFKKGSSWYIMWRRILLDERNVASKDWSWPELQLISQNLNIAVADYGTIQDHQVNAAPMTRLRFPSVGCT